jgi:aconitate hydratase
VAPGTEGGFTTDFTDGVVKTVYEASLSYEQTGIPLIVIGGKDYGMGSSRDWAAKGTFELGIKAVITDSYERIHRSNLVMMGVLPLTFLPGSNAETFGLDGTETYDIAVDDALEPRQEITVTATHPNGNVVEFQTIARVDTPIEVEYLRHGGILHMVLRRMAADHQGPAG